MKDQMTGDELVAQENYEEQFDRDYFNNLDRVDRRDKRGEIVSFTTTKRYRDNYDRIFRSKK